MRILIFVTLAFVLSVGGCHRGGGAGGDPAGGDAPDLGGVDPGAADLGDGDAADMAGGAASDLAGSNPPDMTPPPLVPSDIRFYGGTTGDGWSGVVDSAGTAWALRLADGTARRIADQQTDTWSNGEVIFVWYGGANGFGKLALWNKDGPAVVLADNGLDAVVPPLTDGAGHVSYYTSNGGGIGLLWLGTVDHTAARYINTGFTDLDLPSTCTPKARFFAGRLLVQHCPYPVSQTSTKSVLSSYDVAGTADVDLATDALFFDTAKDVGVLLTSKTGALNLIAADGSGTLTQTPLATDARSATFTPDGSAAIVVTRSSGLERIDLTTHAVTALQASGVHALEYISNDGNYAAYMLDFDDMNGRTDLWLSDARNAGTTAVALVPTNESFRFGYDFTADSAYAIYLANAAMDDWMGSLRARPVAGGSERVIAEHSDQATPVGGSRIVFTENEAGSYPDLRADLSFVDLASGDAPTKIATQAYYQYQVLSDGKTLVYLQPGDGLHAVQLP